MACTFLAILGFLWGWISSLPRVGGMMEEARCELLRLLTQCGEWLPGREEGVA